MTTLSDLKTTVEGLCALADRAIALGQGIIPGRINQDVLENWFGHHRQAGGSNQNMTGMPSRFLHFWLHKLIFMFVLFINIDRQRSKNIKFGVIKIPIRMKL